jgi:hypothetical protein
MLRHLLLGSVLVAASLGLAAAPAAACDDDCDCDYYGGYYGDYYGRPAYGYYGAPVYAAPVHYPAPAYYAPPAYYPPIGYYSGPYGWPYHGWRGGYVDAGHARGKGNFVAPNAGPRAAYAQHPGTTRIGKMPSRPPVAAPALRVERARATNPGMRPPTAIKPPPVKQPTAAALGRDAAAMVRLTGSGTRPKVKP